MSVLLLNVLLFVEFDLAAHLLLDLVLLLSEVAEVEEEGEGAALDASLRRVPGLDFVKEDKGHPLGDVSEIVVGHAVECLNNAVQHIPSALLLPLLPLLPLLNHLLLLIYGFQLLSVVLWELSELELELKRFLGSIGG